MDDLGAPQPSSCPVCGLSRASSEHIISCQADRIQELAQELAELKRRLSIYENSNSPPSRNSLLYREMKSKRKAERMMSEGENVPAPRKPGRRDGHDGVTQVFTPTTGRAVVHRMDRCPACDSPRLVVKATKRRTVVDIPEPLPYTVREHVVNVYSCADCGADGLVPESAKKALPSSSVEAIARGDHRDGGYFSRIGYGTFSSATYALWVSTFAVGMTMFAIMLFRNHFNSPGRALEVL